MNVLNREVFDKQTASIFPSWTSRVRSPSPAFSFIDLRAYRFRKYSKYSVKGQMQRFPGIYRRCPRCKQSHLTAADSRSFATASLGVLPTSHTFGRRCAVSANVREVGPYC